VSWPDEGDIMRPDLRFDQQRLVQRHDPNEVSARLDDLPLLRPQFVCARAARFRKCSEFNARGRQLFNAAPQ
jgi:hypothetical protein